MSLRDAIATCAETGLPIPRSDAVTFANDLIEHLEASGFRIVSADSYETLLRERDAWRFSDERRTALRQAIQVALGVDKLTGEAQYTAALARIRTLQACEMFGEPTP